MIGMHRLERGQSLVHQLGSFARSCAKGNKERTKKAVFIRGPSFLLPVQCHSDTSVVPALFSCKSGETTMTFEILSGLCGNF